jgi:polysaccharide export outer membrane protein
MKMRAALFGLVSFIVSAFAPALAQEAPGQPGSLVATSTAPPPTPTTSTVDQTYVLGAGDEVRMFVYNEPDLTTDVRLGPSGEIVAPLVGALNANGMTTVQLAQALADRYRQGYLRNPQVTVTIAVYRPFYVIGEVTRPGPYPYESSLSLSRAVAIAGGFTSRAGTGRVWVRRNGATSEQAYSINDALALQPGDSVRVGASLWSQVGGLPFWLLR